MRGLGYFVFLLVVATHHGWAIVSTMAWSTVDGVGAVTYNQWLASSFDSDIDAEAKVVQS